MSTRGIVVCVGFDDLLAITLPRNMRFLTSCLVVTSPEDTATKEIAHSVPGVDVFETTAFTDHGAHFNKGLAIEQALDAHGREGWLLIWDADTLFPDNLDFSSRVWGCLHGVGRKILEDVSAWHPKFNWAHAVPHRDDLGVGFFQFFHGSSSPIVNKRPWYDPTFTHAGGCDAHFLDLWPRGLVRRFPFDVLHLGPVATNWYKRASPRADGKPIEEAKDRLRLMNSFIRKYRWTWARPGMKFDTMEELPETPHRVDVPGIGTSDYELPVARPRRGRR